ncbi:MAG TPA: hypothetical protein VKU01_23715 [Bryobacteraceae bacterium]|nr:hypothetical protein [Bryobacteraceae bacterium]
MATEPLTPLRKWIKNTLLTRFPNPGTVWSDTDGKNFQYLTEITHDGLLSKWFLKDKDGKVDYTTTGPDPKFTTCTSFLPVFASRVAMAGKLPPTELRPFKMPVTRGWAPAWLTDAAVGGPKEGDFFLITEQGEMKHVGIIAQIEGQLWSVVAGGQGGRSSRHDGVGRTPISARPTGVFGYLDVDSYFQGWAGPDVG